MKSRDAAGCAMALCFAVAFAVGCYAFFLGVQFMLSYLSMPVIVVGGWFFCGLLLLVAAAWVYSVENRDRWFGYNTLGVVLCLLQLFGSTTPLGYAFRHPFAAVLVLLGFPAIGVAWSLFKFSGVVRTTKKSRDIQLKEWLTDKGFADRTTVPMELEDEWKDYLSKRCWLQKPDPDEYREEIIIWAAYWPASLAQSLVKDFVVGFFASLYERTVHLYKNAADRVWGDTL